VPSKGFTSTTSGSLPADFFTCRTWLRTFGLRAEGIEGIPPAQANFDAGADQVNSRALTFVYYFHREPKAFVGGELRVFSACWRRRCLGRPDRSKGSSLKSIRLLLALKFRPNHKRELCPLPPHRPESDSELHRLLRHRARRPLQFLRHRRPRQFRLRQLFERPHIILRPRHDAPPRFRL
jgi:hypothetical protein